MEIGFLLPASLPYFARKQNANFRTLKFALLSLVLPACRLLLSSRVKCTIASVLLLARKGALQGINPLNYMQMQAIKSASGLVQGQ